MKNIIFILLFLPAMAYSQIGVKAGYITNGYNAGIIIDQPFSDKENIFFDAELLYCGTRYVKDHKFEIDNNGSRIDTEPVYGYNSSIQVPVYIKAKLARKFSPIISAGFMPDYTFKGRNFNTNFLIGTGLTYKRFTFDARYLIEIAENGDNRVNVSLAAILFKK